MLDVMLAGGAAIWLLMTCVWLASLLLRNSGIVDVIWAPGFAVAALVYLAASPQGDPARQALTLTLVVAWALRLGAYLAARNLGAHKAEDYRYRAWREQYGARWWWWSYLQVFLLQGTIMWLVSAPLLAAIHAPQPPAFTVFDLLGAGVWLVGFLFEAVGDWQLTRFKADPANRGKVMRSGLWRYTRHPNYFGNAVMWWGFYLIALGIPGGWLTVFGPALMTFLLMRVSGVALLEQRLHKVKPEYAEYAAQTNAFLPGPPRR